MKNPLFLLFKNRFLLSPLVCLAGLSAGLLMAPTNAGAEPAAGADSALVTLVEGKVALGGQQRRTLAPFTKLRSGDLVSVGADAMVQVTYFVNGRQEKWPERSQFIVGVEKSDPLSGSKPSAVGKISPLLSRELKKTPDGAVASGPVGMVRLRVVPLRLRQIDANYEQYRLEQEPGSVVAEIYKLNSLIELREYDQATEFIRELRAQYPEDKTVSELAVRYLQLIVDTQNNLAPVVSPEVVSPEVPKAE